MSMMGICKWVTLITSASVLGLACYLYSPVPDGHSEPSVMRTYVAAFKLANLLAHTTELVTGVPAISIVRKQIEAMYIPLFNRGEDLHVENLRFDGIPVRLYRPQSASTPAPCVVYFHGGGWSLFTIDSYDTVAAKLSEETNMVVIAVDFRLAPENPYPVPFDDCVKATKHVLHNGHMYGVDSHRVAVAGDGSGGNLAAAVALRLSEEDPEYLAPLKLQVLLQPALQAFTFNTPSYRQNAENSLVGRLQMITFWCHYLGVEPTSKVLASFEQNHHISPSLRRSVLQTYVQEDRLPDFTQNNFVESTLNKYDDDYEISLSQKVESTIVDPFLSPVMADVLTNLPKAYVLVTEFDVVRDDGLFYALRLKEANVLAEMKYVPNYSQGFLAPGVGSNVLKYEDADRVWQEIYSFLRREL